MFTESAEFYDAIYGFKDYAGEAEQIAGRIRSVRPAARQSLTAFADSAGRCDLLD